MLDSIKTLLASKRFLIAMLTVAVDVALVFGVELDPDKLETLLYAVNALALTLIGGISVSDHGKALAMPRGISHKGHGQLVDIGDLNALLDGIGGWGPDADTTDPDAGVPAPVPEDENRV